MSPWELILSLLHSFVCRVEVIPRSPSILICVYVLVCVWFLGFLSVGVVWSVESRLETRPFSRSLKKKKDKKLVAEDCWSRPVGQTCLFFTCSQISPQELHTFTLH